MSSSTPSNPNDPYVGMSDEDRARAIAFRSEQIRLQEARRKAARALLAPPGPALAVRAAWAPLRAFLDEHKAGGGSDAAHRR